MRITLVRNATLLLDVGGRRILVDPMLRPARSTPPIENTPNQGRNPLVELPFAAEEVVRGLDGCIVTHLHGDHFDATASELLPIDLPILTQPESVEGLRERGFTRVSDRYDGWNGLDLTMTRGRHGTGEIAASLGPVSGFVVDGLYVAGDTIWCDEVASVLAEHDPSVVVVNASGARFNEGDPIVMTVDDVRRMREATDGTVIAVHLEAMNHCLETREDVRAVEGVLVPADGETIEA